MMKKRKVLGLLAGVGVGAAIAVGGVSAANAVTEYREGGTWRYGLYEYSSTPYAESHYHHPSKYHRASVINTSGTLLRDYANAGQWADAVLASGWWGSEYYYWVQ